jgi:hypothetical protein
MVLSYLNKLAINLKIKNKELIFANHYINNELNIYPAVVNWL